LAKPIRFVIQTKGVALGYDKYGPWPTIPVAKAQSLSLKRNFKTHASG